MSTFTVLSRFLKRKEHDNQVHIALTPLSTAPSFQQLAAKDVPHGRMHLAHCWTPRASPRLTNPFLNPFIVLAMP